MEKKKRKRFNRNAICSSENYIASKKAHRAMLKEHHASFSLTAMSDYSEDEKNEGLSIKRQIALDRMPVTVSLFGIKRVITMGEYNKELKHLGYPIIK